MDGIITDCNLVYGSDNKLEVNKYSYLYLSQVNYSLCVIYKDDFLANANKDYTNT